MKKLGEPLIPRCTRYTAWYRAYSPAYLRCRGTRNDDGVALDDEVLRFALRFNSQFSTLLVKQILKNKRITIDE